MYAVKQLMARVMAGLKDMTLSSWDVLDKINEANREIYRDVAAYKPEYLVCELSGLGSGVVFPSAPIKIIGVWDNDGKKLLPITQSEISDLKRTGTPFAYYQNGIKEIVFYPAGTIFYTASYVPDYVDLTEEDTTLWPAVWDDRIVEYAKIQIAIREGMKNISGDPLALIKRQLMPSLYSSVTKMHTVRSYW